MRRPSSCRVSRAGARVVVAFGAVASACAPVEAPPVATLRDSAGVRIVEHAASLEGLAPWSLAEPAEAVIGAGDGPAHHFTQVRGAARLSDGRIVVADWGSKEARYFDATGAHLRTVGGEGTGPGEVRFLYAVDRVRGDTLVVGGWPIGTRYWFDERGDFVHGQALGPWFPGMLGRTLPDGSLILDTFEFGSYGNTLERWAVAPSQEDLRPEGIVERVSRDGSTVDTLGVIRGEVHHKTGSWPETLALRALPFSPIGLVAWSADRIYVGHTETPEVRVLTYDGSLHTIIRWERDRVAVTPEDRVAFERAVFDGLRSPDLEPRYRRWLSEIGYPDSKPPFAAMIADEDGHLWVRSSAPGDADSWRWTIYGPDGQARATLRTAPGLDAVEVDASHFLAKTTDSLGVERVHSYRIVR